MKTHVLDKPLSHHEPAHLANGLIGLRIPSIPCLPQSGWRMALVNGFVEVSETFSTQACAQSPYPLGLNVVLDGVVLSERPELAHFIEQRYDFSCGELTSRFDLKAGDGPSAHVEMLTFCSRTLPSMVLQRTKISVDRSCKLKLQARIDAGGLPGSVTLRQRLGNQRPAAADWAMRYDARGSISSLGMAMHAQLTGSQATAIYNDWGIEADAAITEYSLDALPGKTYELTQMAALVPSTMHSEPHWQAARLCMFARHHGFDTLREQNAQAWAELWRGRPVILGADDHWQQTADAAFFYLHSSIHQAMPMSVAPFGLSRQVQYNGHVFWDTEGFIFPAAQLTYPAAARAMLDYRFEKASAARNMARLHGLRGLQYPWQTATAGDEVTPLWSKAEAQHFASLPIAWAFLQDVYATGDDSYRNQHAWPVIEGVCEWIVSRAEKTRRGYEFRIMRGPDESVPFANNCAYVNAMAIHILNEAIALSKSMGFSSPPLWQKVADRIYLPMDEDGALIKWDGWEYQGGMTSMEIPPLFHHFGYSHSERTDRATLDKYMPMAPHYIGMPMNSYNMAVVAARLGDAQLARRFFDTAAHERVIDPFMQFGESGRNLKTPFDPRKSLFVTNPGAMITALLYGLPGLKWGPGDPDQWAHWKPAMPQGWEGIHCERIWARGKPMSLTARQGDEKATLQALDE